MRSRFTVIGMAFAAVGTIALGANQPAWVADGVQNRLHVFDASVYPPVARAAIDGIGLVSVRGGEIQEIRPGDVVYIERFKNLRQTMSLFLRSGFSRIPVVGENEDDVIGIAYLKDVVRRDFEAPEVEFTQRVEEVMRVNYLGGVWCSRVFMPGLEAAARAGGAAHGLHPAEQALADGARRTVRPERSAQEGDGGRHHDERERVEGDRPRRADREHQDHDREPGRPAHQIAVQPPSTGSTEPVT